MSIIPNAAAVTEKLPRFLRRHKFMKAWMQVTRESPLQLVRIRDNSFAFADMDDGFMRLIPIDQDFNEDFFDIADQLLADGGTFFDVGANYGLLSFGLAGRHGGNIDFHLFEADARLASFIARSQERYPDMRCTMNVAAVFSQSGVVRFKVDEAQTGASHICEADEPGGLEVPAITLDAYIKGEGITRVDLLKLDIEGFELSSLRGSETNLKNRVIRAVYFEYFEKWLVREGAPSEIIAYLDSMGFVTCFCRECDFQPRGRPSHTILEGLPGHGLELLPVSGYTMPPMTDLLALPAEHLMSLA
jgi:FkbM family methyltransferase